MDSTMELLIPTPEELQTSFHALCGYSVYSHQPEIKSGFVTALGGHRVGICGTAVRDGRDMTGIRDLSSMNIRVARQVAGAADELLHKLESLSGGLLLAGAPSSGKTTILRDLARQLSLGQTCEMKKVVVVDERGELAGTCGGIPQNDLGLCDVLDGYAKGEGILQAVRCLSPDFIICDEVGGLEDIAAIEEGLNAGVSMVASIHAGSMPELMRRSQYRRLLATGAFRWVALLQTRASPGKLQGIYQVGDLDVKANGMSTGDCGGRHGGLDTVA